MSRLQNKCKAAAIALLTAHVMLAGSVLAADWWEKIKFSGDFRFRHELIDQEGRELRNRQRIRARFGFQAEVSDYANVTFRLASGSDDPVSTNQTLGDAGSSKSIVLDLAYLEAKYGKLPGFKLVAGKMKNPFMRPGKTELIWDSDWTPEGGALTYSSPSEKVSIIITAAGFSLVERSSDDNSYLAAIQGTVKLKSNDKKTSTTLGASYFNYVNVKGFRPFFDKNDGFGNFLVDVSGGFGPQDLRYFNDYKLFELLGEVTHKFGNFPVTTMGDYVRNTDITFHEKGWLIGVQIGKVKKVGSWQVRLLYKRLEWDAVLGAVTNSDFIGGGTGGKGHILSGAYQLAKNTALKATYFANKIPNSFIGPIDYDRFQADVVLKF